MTSPVGMTLSESGALARLEHFVQAVFLTDNTIDPKEAREIGRQLRAVRLFVKAESRGHAQAALEQVVAVFSETRWASDIDKIVVVIRRRFQWEVPK